MPICFLSHDPLYHNANHYLAGEGNPSFGVWEFLQQIYNGFRLHLSRDRIKSQQIDASVQQRGHCRSMPICKMLSNPHHSIKEMPVLTMDKIGKSKCPF